MKYIKLTDLLTQCFLILLAVVLLLTEPSWSAAFQAFYFFLGGWQLISFLIQLFFSRESWYQQRPRLQYGITICCTIAGALLLGTVGIPFVLIYLWAVVFITPFFAGWYLYISFRELQIIRLKELIHLKN